MTPKKVCIFSSLFASTYVFLIISHHKSKRLISSNTSTTFNSSPFTMWIRVTLRCLSSSNSFDQARLRNFICNKPEKLFPNQVKMLYAHLRYKDAIITIEVCKTKISLFFEKFMLFVVYPTSAPSTSLRLIVP